MQITKKRKKTLVLEFNSLTPDELIKSGRELRVRIRKVMSKHVGRDNAISTRDLFEQVLDVDAEKLDVFQRQYWWNILKTILKQLRHDDELFTVISQFSVFVLKTTEELEKYKKTVDKHITSLNNLKEKATRWVEDSRWRDI